MKRTVLITGASGGIGFELARLYGAAGCNLILVGSNEDRLKKAREALLIRPHGEIYTIVRDLSETGAAKSLYEQVKSDGHQVDLLVNNAGFGLIGSEHELDFAREERMLILNMVTPTELCRLFLPDMYERGEGHILNVCSVGAFQPGPYNTAYFASKAYLLSYSRGIAFEAKSHGVKVSALCPGTTKTGFWSKAGTSTPFYAGSAVKVAKAAYDGVKHGKTIITPGFFNKVLYYIPGSISMFFIGKAKLFTSAKSSSE